MFGGGAGSPPIGADGPDDRRREQRVFRALLRAARREAGLRQQDLAERLGVPQPWISRAENGERRLDVLELRRVCHALGLPLAEFVERLETALAEAER